MVKLGQFIGDRLMCIATFLHWRCMFIGQICEMGGMGIVSAK